MEWVLFFIQMIIGFLAVGFIPPMLYFELRYRIKDLITHPLIEGLTAGIIWSVLFLFSTARLSSPVGTVMAAPFIITGFPIAGLIVGSFYGGRKRPLTGRKTVETAQGK